MNSPLFYWEAKAFFVSAYPIDWSVALSFLHQLEGIYDLYFWFLESENLKNL